MGRNLGITKTRIALAVTYYLVCSFWQLLSVSFVIYGYFVSANNSSAVADILPTLQPGQCLVVGAASPIPAIVQLEKPNPEPQSKNIDVYDVWKEEWKEIDKNEPVTLNDVLKRWRR